VAASLRRLIDAGLDALPLPGAGATLVRWRALAAVGAHDLALAKLYEGHTDALAILAELRAGHAPQQRSCVWGVWAAEPPDGRVVVERHGALVRLRGIKRWCSGAASSTHALLTAWTSDGREPLLVELALAQPGVRIDASGWHALGMGRSASADVHLDGAHARLLGVPGAYLARPGFWHGGAGVAACWYGACRTLASLLRGALEARGAGASDLLASACGRVDIALRMAAALMREVAARIDAQPAAPAQADALRVRLAMEALAEQVLLEVGRTLGPAPLCRDLRIARLAADLPVFIRQSHGARDQAALAQTALAHAELPNKEPPGWML